MQTHPENLMNIESIIETGGFPALENFVRTSIKNMEGLMEAEQYEELREQLNFQIGAIRGLKTKYSNDENIAKLIKHYYLCLFRYKSAIEHHNNKERAPKNCEALRGLNIPELEIILKTILQSGNFISHQRLANLVKMEEDVLCKLTDILIKHQAIKSVGPDKERHYLTTPTGQIFADGKCIGE